MAEVELTQVEADALMALEKVRESDDNQTIPAWVEMSASLLSPWTRENIFSST